MDIRKQGPRRGMRRAKGPLAPTGAALVCAASIMAVAPGGTAAAAPMRPVVSCTALAGETIGGVLVTSAQVVPATASVPAYCKVDGTKAGSELDIEARLPDEWERRFVQEGGGGYDGFIPRVGKRDVALDLHAVQVATNGGHRDPTGRDLLRNEAKVRLFAHGAIGEGARFGKAVTEKYYGVRPSFSYFEGCSNGGRGALNAADKYGDQFDAVIAGAPTTNLPGQIEQWTRAAQLQLPSPSKLSALYAAAISKCDGLDGAKDGIISNWAGCRFDPTVDAPPDAHITTVEALAVKALMSDIKLADGSTVYSGFGFGAMDKWAAAYGELGVGHMRYIVLNDPEWAPKTFTADGYYRRIADVIDGVYGFDASLPGLAAYLQSGKKIIVWHGSDDTLLSHRDTIRNWLKTVALAGPKASGNARLFIASGVSHCFGGPGADTFDLLTPTVLWVEQGVPIATPTAAKLDEQGAVKFTRPLCQYPRYPRYDGAGDVGRASSYSCAKP